MKLPPRTYLPTHGFTLCCPGWILDQQRALTLSIQDYDKDALVNFINVDKNTTSLLINKKRSKTLCLLFGTAPVERLKIPRVRGNKSKDHLEEMLQKRGSISKQYSNFWLEPTKMEMYPDHVNSFQELLDYLDKCLVNNDILVSDFKHMIEDAKQHRAHKKISKIQNITVGFKRGIERIC